MGSEHVLTCSVGQTEHAHMALSRLVNNIIIITGAAGASNDSRTLTRLGLALTADSTAPKKIH